LSQNYVNPVAGEQILLKPSFDGGTTFNHPALINTSRGITFTLTTTTDEIVDSNNPSNPAQTIRSAKATDTKLDGAGIMDANSVTAYMQWAAHGVAQPVKLITNSANNVTVSGSYFLTSFQIQGTRAQKATVTLTLEQASGTTITVV
jgi:predicted secreted protein